MAFATFIYTGDGVTTDFLFTAPRISDADILAQVDLTATTVTYSGSEIYSFVTAPAEGSQVVLYRNSNQSAPINLFPNKSYINTNNLDTNFLQAIYMHQEQNDLFERAFATFVGDALEAFLTDAPVDSQEYVRKDGGWSVATVGPSAGIPDAPADGAQYARKNNAWEAVVSAGGETKALSGAQTISSTNINHGDVIVFPGNDGAGMRIWELSDPTENASIVIKSVTTSVGDLRLQSGAGQADIFTIYGERSFVDCISHGQVRLTALDGRWYVEGETFFQSS